MFAYHRVSRYYAIIDVVRVVSWDFGFLKRQKNNEKSSFVIKSCLKNNIFQHDVWNHVNTDTHNIIRSGVYVLNATFRFGPITSHHPKRVKIWYAQQNSRHFWTQFSKLEIIKTLLRHQIPIVYECLCLRRQFLYHLRCHKLKTENSISATQNDFDVTVSIKTNKQKK